MLTVIVINPLISPEATAHAQMPERFPHVEFSGTGSGVYEFFDRSSGEIWVYVGNELRFKRTLNTRGKPLTEEASQ